MEAGRWAGVDRPEEGVNGPYDEEADEKLWLAEEGQDMDWPLRLKLSSISIFNSKVSMRGVPFGSVVGVRILGMTYVG